MKSIKIIGLVIVLLPLTAQAFIKPKLRDSIGAWQSIKQLPHCASFQTDKQAVIVDTEDTNTHKFKRLVKFSTSPSNTLQCFDAEAYVQDTQITRTN